MASSPSAARTRPDVDADVLSAASAVFGALEVIAETTCSEATQRELDLAARDAHGCLSQLGATRSDLVRVGPTPRERHATVTPIRRLR
jgi:hypothetical protein